eukprot:3630894-Amphidinium_carterae.2
MLYSALQDGMETRGKAEALAPPPPPPVPVRGSRQSGRPPHLLGEATSLREGAAALVSEARMAKAVEMGKAAAQEKAKAKAKSQN